MKSNKNSLKIKIWLYLILFTFIIMILLWFFQIVFLNTFYEYNKTNDIKSVSNQIILNYDKINDINLDKLAFDNDICIEITDNMITKYSSMSVGCINNNKYKSDFYNSKLKNTTYKVVNQKFNNKTLIHATNLGNGKYLFVSSSLQPLDTTVRLLSKQLIIVSIIDIIIALIIGYFISKKISSPIENINKKASLLAQGKYDFKFNENCNIYEIDELANTLDYAKEELKETDELRRDLLANVSHDLKTPLTMIKGYAEMIRDLNNEEKRIDNLNVIIEETDRLNLLVEDILELSKLQSNKEKLNIESFDLSELIKTIIKRYDIFKETDGYIFELNIPDKIIVSADKKKIEQVIYNLINNAINYTGNDNKVIINIENKNGILIEIKDTGKGIKKDEIPYIWDKYYHSKKKHKRNKIGTGIGLSIVKNILEIHGFKYGVKSSNKGTTFYFIIK